MIRNLIGVLTTCATALLLVPAESWAQDQSASPLMVKHRADCRLAAQVLITGQPRTRAPRLPRASARFETAAIHRVSDHLPLRSRALAQRLTLASP
jgi:hypothetical protein